MPKDTPRPVPRETKTFEAFLSTPEISLNQAHTPQIRLKKYWEKT
jgi:hypothetical protein